MNGSDAKLTHPKYRKDIDGLRAIAILSVVGYHAFPEKFYGGYIGVDIFFAISGFLISSIIFENLENDSFSFIEFYKRRIKRIFPALLLVMIASFVFGWFVLLPAEYMQLGKHIFGGAGFVSNLLFWNESGYFDNLADTKPLLHLWSLGIEEQFYIVWPLLLWIAARRKANLLVITISTIVASFAFNIYSASNNVIADFYSPLTRFWELLFGALAAWLSLNNNRADYFSLQQKNIASVVGFGLIVFGVALLKNSIIFPGWWALVPSFGALLIVLSGQNAVINRLVLSNKILVWFGLISYPLYLWHWPLISFARIVENRAPDTYILFRLVLVAVLLAWLTYKFIEKPIRSNLKNNFTVPFLLVAMVMVGLLGLSTNLFWNGLESRPFARSINPNYLMALGDWAYPRGLIERKLNGVKVFSNSNGPVEVLFIGDSHIEQFGPRIVYLTQKNNIRNIAFLTMAGLPIPNICSNGSNQCGVMTKNIETILEGNSDIKTIVIGSAFNGRFIADLNTDKGEYFIKDGHKEYFYHGNGGEMAIEELGHFLKKLSLGHKVFLLLDNPEDAGFDPKNMISPNGSSNRLYFMTNNQHKTVVTKQIPLPVEQKLLNDRLMKVASQVGVETINQLPTICPGDMCIRLSEEDVPVYLDGSHLRPWFVTERSRYLDKAILVDNVLKSNISPVAP